MATDNQKAAYRSIFKATSIFGSTQVIVILIHLIRSKFSAYYLGTEGYGINSLLNNPIHLITTISGLGISYSAIRNIAAAAGSNDQDKLDRTLSVYYELVKYTCLLGIGMVLLLSPFLSLWSFKDYSHWWQFAILAITVAFTTFAQAYNGTLRGMRKTKLVAKMTVLPQAISLVIVIPMYYFFGIDGILPVLFLSPLIVLLLSRNYVKGIHYNKLNLTRKEIFQEGAEMVKLGGVMTLANMLGQLSAYIILLIIGHFGGVSEVGLYNAGNTLTNMYVGMIFASLTADYYPRLAAIIHDKNKTNETANQQGELLLLLLCPLITILMFCMPLVVKILLTDKFLPIIDFVRLMSLGIIFKATSWVIAIIFTAKGNKKLYFQNEFIAFVLNVVLCYAGYRIAGLHGLGIAFILQYLSYTLVVYYFGHTKFEYQFSKSFLGITAITVALCTISYFCSSIEEIRWMIVAACIMIPISCGYSFMQLNKKMNLLSTLKKKIKK